MHSLSDDDWNHLFSAPLTPAVFANLAANGVFPLPTSSLPQDYNRNQRPIPPRDPSQDYHNDHAAWSLPAHHTPRIPFSKQHPPPKQPPHDQPLPQDPSLRHHKPHRIAMPVSPRLRTHSVT